MRKRRNKKNTFRFLILLFLLIVLGILIYLAINERMNDNSYKEIKDNKIENKNSDKNDDNPATVNNKETNNASVNQDNKNQSSATEVISPKETNKEETKQEVDLKEKINIVLNGDEEITIKIGDSFEDPGAKATSESGKDVSSNIIVSSELNNSKTGRYRIFYYIGNNTVVRYVNVVE